jgi:hypothetical protein
MPLFSIRTYSKPVSQIISDQLKAERWLTGLLATSQREDTEHCRRNSLT